jgi:hypothetical protein
MKSLVKTIKGLAVLAVLFCVSCGNKNPVSQETLTVAVGANILNSNFESTLLRCELLFDGSPIATANFSQPSNNATLAGSATSVKKGKHTISFKIANQTSSPNTYETVGANVVTGGNSTFRLTDQKKLLATGGSISFQVDLR